MYHKKIIVVTILFLLLTTSCSSLNQIVYQPNIDQGNYLTSTDIKKIKKGMTKKEVLHILGTPMLKDLFGTQTWFYICRQQLYRKKVRQQTLSLTFNNFDVLIKINKKSS
ncbi:Outer membrane protein assembly factor BamE [Candidatus Ecksteinia adelgidicola]|nr:Outer membrane protein assembly factor BamE [Candidatus Ecksteinia adelgidicola]